METSQVIFYPLIGFLWVWEAKGDHKTTTFFQYLGFEEAKRL